MARLILLDSGPLGLAVSPPGGPSDICRAQLVGWATGGAFVLIPDIVDYEVRRELLRRNAGAAIHRLDELGRTYRPARVTSDALRRAAELWAHVRRQGLPTAADRDIDIDAMLAGLAGTIGGLTDHVTIATGNVDHFRRFPGIDARPWDALR